MNNDLISRSALLEKRFKMHSNFLGSVPVVAVKDIEAAPAVDAEKVCEQMGLVKEAFEMAKADLMPVVRCKDCEHCLINLKWNTALCMRTVFRQSVPLDGFCNFGERMKGR